MGARNFGLKFGIDRTGAQAVKISRGYRSVDTKGHNA